MTERQSSGFLQKCLERLHSLCQIESLFSRLVALYRKNVIGDVLLEVKLLLHLLWGVGENKRNDVKGYRIP